MGIFSSPQMASPPPPPPLPPAANPPTYAGSESMWTGAMARARAQAQGGTPGGQFGTHIAENTVAPTANKALVGAGGM